jgi:hypothetical protein
LYLGCEAQLYIIICYLKIEFFTTFFEFLFIQDESSSGNEREQKLILVEKVDTKTVIWQNGLSENYDDRIK